MKVKIKAAIPVYRQRQPKAGSKTKAKPEMSGSMILREAIALPGIGLSIPVRAAKAKLSALLEMVAGGQEVTITSDGKPKAVLLPVAKSAKRKVFTGTWEHLQKMPMQTEGPFAEEIIRADRDGRGW